MSRRRTHGRASPHSAHFVQLSAAARAGAATAASTCPDDRRPHDTVGLSGRDAPRGGAGRPAELDPGAPLRAARERRGLSLDDVMRATKITPKILVALEQGDVDRLPAAVYTRGFLKAYASAVGLNPAATVERYLTEIDRPDMLAGISTVGASSAHTHAWASQQDRRPGDAEDGASVPASRSASRLVTAACVVGLVAYAWSFSRPAPQSTADAARVDEAEAMPASATPSAAPDAVVLSAHPVGQEGPLQFELRPRGPCWLVAHADGATVVARLLGPGESRTIEVHDELWLRVGDPAALSFSINGRTGRVLGKPGEPVNVRITKDNFRNFLSL